MIKLGKVTEETKSSNKMFGPNELSGALFSLPS